MDKIKLDDVKIIFANTKDEGFGRSLTIDVTDQAIQDKISEWVETNKIGKTTPGKANFKEYKPDEGDKVIQYSFKLNDYTKFVGVGGLTIDDLGYGAEVSLIAQAFQYDNKFGKGTSASLSAVLIEKAIRTSADDDIDELLQGAGVDPSEAKSGYEKAKETADSLRSAEQVAKDAKEVTGGINDKGEINLDDIPF
jgi:hypothetical protein